MSAFFSGCVGLHRAAPVPGAAAAKGRRRADAERFCRAHAACSDSGRERRAFPEILTARGCHSVRMASVSGLPPPRRRPGKRSAPRLHDLGLWDGKHPPVSNEPAGFGLLGRGGSTPHFPAASPPEYRTFRGKQKMAANKKINNFSSKAPLFQLPTPQGGPPLRCFT